MAARRTPPAKPASPGKRAAAPKPKATPRKTAAAAQQAVGRYDAAGNGRRLAGWTPPASGPRQAVQGTGKMRDRARDAARNDWTGESGAQKWASTLIGVGITPRFDRLKNATRKQEILDLYNDWAKTVDADGVLDFYGLQTLAVRSWFVDGEVFVRLRYRRADSPLPVPFQVQLLEADFCPLNFDADQWPGLLPGNKIRQGIELDSYSRRIAYWMFKEHPGERTSAARAPVPGALVRVPADEVKHLYLPARIGALRGASLLASVLTRLRNAGDFEDTVLTRQQLANLWTVFITRELPPDSSDIDYDPDTGLPKWYDKDGNPVVKLQAGMSQELAPGEDVKFPNPPEAGTSFTDYLRTVHMGTAAGAGIPYELFAGDIREVSDRTLRVVMLEFRRLARQRQWQHVIPMLCQPAIEGFADAALLVGKIGVDELQAVRRPKWQPEGFEHIHPMQDPQGKIMEVEAGLRSRDSVIAERGDDPDEVDAERKAAQDRADKLGLEQKSPTPAAPGQQPGSGGGGKPGRTTDAVAQAQFDLQIATIQAETAIRVAQANARADAAEERARAADERALAADARTDVANARADAAEERARAADERALAAAAREADARVAAAWTEGRNTVLASIETQRAAEAQVRDKFFEKLADSLVAATAGRPIQVEAPTVNVAPVVNLPDREIVTENVEHDAQGRIVSVRQVEKTIQ